MGISTGTIGKVRVEPSGAEFEVNEGENIRTAAIRNGYRWPSTCGGAAECMLCSIEILDGRDHLGTISEREAATLKRLKMAMPHIPDGVRLACQTTITDDIVVKKRGVSPLADRGSTARLG